MSALEPTLFDLDLYKGRLIGKAQFTPVERYPKVGELVWLDTDEETNYHGEAYVYAPDTTFWEVVNPADPEQVEHIVIAVNDQYIIIGNHDGKSRYQPMTQVRMIQVESEGNVIPMDGFSLTMECHLCHKSDTDPTAYGFGSWDEYDPFGSEWLICNDCIEDWTRNGGGN